MVQIQVHCAKIDYKRRNAIAVEIKCDEWSKRRTKQEIFLLSTAECSLDHKNKVALTVLICLEVDVLCGK